MFNPTGTLTNQKPAKDSKPVITLTPTKGIIRVNTHVAKLMNVTAEQYLAVEGGTDAEGKVVFALYLGHKSDEEQGLSQVGSKLAFPSSRNAGNLQMSSSNAWISMGGVEKEKSSFVVSDETVEFEGVVYFPLIPRSKEEDLAEDLDDLEQGVTEEGGAEVDYEEED